MEASKLIFLAIIATAGAAAIDGSSGYDYSDSGYDYSDSGYDNSDSGYDYCYCGSDYSGDYSGYYSGDYSGDYSGYYSGDYSGGYSGDYSGGTGGNGTSGGGNGTSGGGNGTGTAPTKPYFKCGSKTTDRIVNGNEADANSIPWQVAIASKGSSSPFCGGTIISPYHIMTAAHCTGNDKAMDIQVIVAEHDITNSNDGQVVHAVKCIRNHAKYDSDNLNFDFSILTLTKKIELDDKAAAACLPFANLKETYAGKTLTVSGWGKHHQAGSSISSTLHHVDVKGMSNKQCRNSYPSITNAMLCAGPVNDVELVDSCQGDSGGPLTYTKNGVTSLVGVVSWGKGCAEKGYPGVYARITEVKDWILQGGVYTDYKGKPKC